MLAYLIGGKHIGSAGIIESVDGSKIKIKLGKDVYETAKRYAFVLGKDNPVVALNAK